MTALPVVVPDAPIVLLVDDDPAIRTFMARALDQEGYTVLTAPDGAEAMGIVEQLRQPLALVVTDLRMPVVGGEELAGWLARQSPATAVLFITGFSARYDPRNLCAPLLHKPFGPDELCAQVRRVLSGPGSVGPEALAPSYDRAMDG